MWRIARVYRCGNGWERMGCTWWRHFAVSCEASYRVLLMQQLGCKVRGEGRSSVWWYTRWQNVIVLRTVTGIPASFLHNSNTKQSGFGGLEVACWPLVPKFAGSNPAKAVRFLRAIKILSTPSFGGEVKPSVPCCRFPSCKRSLNVTWKSTFRQNYRPWFLPMQFHLSLLGVSRVTWTRTTD